MNELIALLGDYSTLENVQFSKPEYFILNPLLWLSAFASLGILALKFLFRPKKTKYSRYKLFGSDMFWLFSALACGILIVALAGPKISHGFVISRGGSIDVLVIIDDSFSTEIDDIKPSRLEVAKTLAMNLVQNNGLKSGDRITLFVFATKSRWRMPLSEDFSDFKSKIAEISHPKVFEEESQLDTDFAGVLDAVPKCMDKQDGFAKENRWALGLDEYSNSRIAILISDGNDEWGGKFAPEVRELNRRKIKFYTVGIGTKLGKKISIQAYNTNDPQKKDKITITSKLNMNLLNAIAQYTGGESFAVESPNDLPRANNFLQNAISDNRSSLPRLNYSDEMKDIWWEVLLIGFLLIILGVLRI